MTTYNTGNPIGSKDARDLYDNAQNLDNFSNGSAASYTDRLGVSRRSLAGIDATADDVLNGIGYAVPVAYASGISLTLTSHTVEYAGEIYAPKSSALPFTTSSWGADSAKFRLMIASDASRVNYTPAGTGAVVATVQSKLRETVSAVDRGADPTGVADSSAAIIKALSDASHVVVTPGTYRCDSMIELNTGKTLQLMGGATLIRKSANSASTDPVVWIKGSTASFFGAGLGVSTVKSENRSPNGVIRLGHKDMTESHADVTYCSLGNMSIAGAIGGGQTSGSPDVALYMPNPQFGGKVSYFHTLYNLRVQDANFGIWLHGYANANTASNIQGFRLGNTTLGANTNAMVFCNGALDNAFSNAFFHASSNSIGLLVSNYDNTSNGGANHLTYSNMFTNMVFEQGGASAYGVKLLSGTRNVFIVRDNVAFGNSTADATNYIHGLSDNINPNGIIARDYLKAATYVEAKNEIRTYGSSRLGDSNVIYSAKKTKRGAATNASTLTFTISVAAQASIYRHGYLKILASGGDAGSGSAGAVSAEFLYSIYTPPGVTNLGLVTPAKSSVGDTASFTMSLSGQTLTISTTLDHLVATVEVGYTSSAVDVT